MTEKEELLMAECEKLVKREVIYCISTLISELANLSQFQDDLMPILSRTKTVYTCDDEHKIGCFFETSDKNKMEKHTLENHNSVEFSEEERTEEALEHWIVSRWLGNKLEEHGEMITKFIGLTIWGRQTSGQAISLDGVMEAIVKELEWVTM